VVGQALAVADKLPTKSHLERLVAAHGASTDIGHARVRRWVSTMVIIGALARVRDEDDQHRFVIKGGLAMELRLGTSARATADVDITFYGDPALLEESLANAFADPISGFSVRMANTRSVGLGVATRSSLRLEYQNKPWSTVDLEISTAEPPADIELIPAFTLEHFGLDGPTHVATLSTRYQVAQKIHAVSKRFEVGPNLRVRDIIDILLLRDLLPPLSEVRDACIDVFESRGEHAWPPTITTYEEWTAVYAGLRDLIEFDVPNVDQAVEEVHVLIDAIDKAHRPGV
jgi:hypothetical protein